jgi:hypothetical protein
MKIKNNVNEKYDIYDTRIKERQEQEEKDGFNSEDED